MTEHDSKATSVTAVVLAGGRGRRMGEQDKGWIRWRGRPLVQHVIERLRPQVTDIIISGNRHLKAYQALGFPCIVDTISGYAGPLAGISAALPHVRTDEALIVPCDAPLLPDALAERLQHSLHGYGADICYAWDGRRDQYLFALMRRSVLRELENYLKDDNRSVKGWYEQMETKTVDFSDMPGAFININTPDDLASQNT